jgi:putative transcriptional regulator
MGRKRIRMKELSRMTGLSYPTVLSLYHEKTTVVNYRVVEKICEALDVQIGDLFEYIKIELGKREKGKVLKTQDRKIQI